MSKADISAVERIVANTINETARGDPDALATRIVAALYHPPSLLAPPSVIQPFVTARALAIRLS
jgi:hypothetical protein